MTSIQVFMQPEELRALENLAARRSTTVPALVREAARDRYLAGPPAPDPPAVTDERRAEAARRFLALPDVDLPPWAELKRELEDRLG